MICPKCGRPVPDAAVICPGCDFILDTDFLGDEILDEDKRLRPGKGGIDPASFNLADAVILGDMDEKSQVFDTQDTGFHVKETTSARLYVTGRSQAVMAPDAVPAKTGNKYDKRRLTPFERHLLGYIDGVRPVEVIQREAGLDDAEVKTALATLTDKGVVHVIGRALVELEPMEVAQGAARKRRQRYHPDIVGAVALVGDDTEQALEESFRTQTNLQRPSSEELRGPPSRSPLHRPETDVFARHIDEDGNISVRSLRFDEEDETSAKAGRPPSLSEPDDGSPMGWAGDDGATGTTKSELRMKRNRQDAARRDDGLDELDDVFSDEADAFELDEAPTGSVEGAANIGGTLAKFRMPHSPSLLLNDAQDDLETRNAPDDDSSGLFDSDVSSLPGGGDDDDDLFASLSGELDSDDDEPVAAGPRGDFADDSEGETKALSGDASSDFSSDAFADHPDFDGDDDMFDEPTRAAPGVLQEVLRRRSKSVNAEAPLDDEAASQDDDVDDDSETGLYVPGEGVVDPKDVSSDVFGDDADDFAKASPMTDPAATALLSKQPNIDKDGGGTKTDTISATGKVSTEQADDNESSVELISESLVVSPVGKKRPPSADDEAGFDASDDGDGDGLGSDEATEARHDAVLDIDDSDEMRKETAQYPQRQRVSMDASNEDHRPMSSGSKSPEEAAQLKEKAARLFADAEEDFAAGRVGAARMNAKLASIYDAENPTYKKALDEWENPEQVSDDEKPPEVVLYEQAQKAEAKGRVDEAMSLLRDGLQKNPDVPAIHNRLGVLLALQKKDYEKAAACIRKAIELEPENLHYKNNLGKILSRKKRKQRRPAGE